MMSFFNAGREMWQTQKNNNRTGQRGKRLAAVHMKSAQLSAVGWVVVVRRSSALSSVYQHRDCLVAVLWRERLATTLT